MDEKGFELFLTPRLGLPSVRSYVSYCRRVERNLEIDLGLIELTDVAIANIEARLRRLVGLFVGSSVSNCMTAVRRYAEFSAAVPTEKPLVEGSPGDVRTSSKLARSVAGVEEPVVAKPEVISSSGVRELLILHSQIMDELRERGIVRTGNGPAGDYAEKLFERAFGWQLESNSKSSYDAIKDGVRYQIKSRRITARNGSRQLGALRRLPDRTFDMLAAILFDGRVSPLHT